MRRFYDVIQDEGGNIVAGAEFYVRDQGDNSLVTLYSDDGSTTTANPVVSDSGGYVDFWTADNTLKFEVYIDGELERTIAHYQHFDLDNITAAAWTILDDASVGDIRTTLGVGTGDSPQFTAINLGHASDTTIARSGAGDITIEGNAVYRAGGTDVPVTDGGTGASSAADARTNLGINSTNVKLTESFIVAISDETTAITTGNAKVTIRMPYAFTVSDVRASLATAQTSGSVVTVDINDSGTTILSTKLTIDNGEKTSTTAATPAVISDASLADDAEITIDIDTVGDGTAKGLKVTLIGTRT